LIAKKDTRKEFSRGEIALRLGVNLHKNCLF